jgi:thiosulfate/3-mercaptopyruvate sulfurtransferase
MEMSASLLVLMLTQPEELAKKLQEPGLRVLDCRAQSDYQKGHVPGAVWVDVKAWQRLHARDGGLHDARAWSQQVGALGIGKDSVVVVYGGSLPDAARVWWTLKYVGVANVMLLDGGWELWSKRKGPTETESPSVAPAHFEPAFQADRLEEIDALKRSMQSGKVTVVDARSTKEFAGDEVRGKRGGHIAGAKHLDWKELLAEDGRFRSLEQLRELFRRRGIELDRTVVTC